MSIMETLNNFAANVTANPAVVLVWASLVLLFLFWGLAKESFKNEFKSAPIASQLPSELLGIGAGSRASVEFSSTNQGRTNLNSREHMTASMEVPMTSMIDQSLTDNQNSTVKTEEAFSNRVAYEGFANPESYLVGKMHGN